MVLVDNNIYGMAFQLDNGIPIVGYVGEEEDVELKYLSDYLCDKILGVADVRPVNGKAFELNNLVEISRQQLFE